MPYNSPLFDNLDQLSQPALSPLQSMLTGAATGAAKYADATRLPTSPWSALAALAGGMGGGLRQQRQDAVSNASSVADIYDKSSQADLRDVQARLAWWKMQGLGKFADALYPNQAGTPPLGPMPGGSGGSPAPVPPPPAGPDLATSRAAPAAPGPSSVEPDTDFKGLQVPIDDNDLELSGRMAFAEAGNQGPAGRRAVLQTMVNRLATGQFGNSMKAMLNAPKQFEPAGANGGVENLLPLTAAQRAEIKDHYLNMAMGQKDPTNGSLFFLNRKVAGQRNTDFGANNDENQTAQIGDHTFYKGLKGKDLAQIPDFRVALRGGPQQAPPAVRLTGPPVAAGGPQPAPQAVPQPPAPQPPPVPQPPVPGAPPGAVPVPPGNLAATTPPAPAPGIVPVSAQQPAVKQGADAASKEWPPDMVPPAHTLKDLMNLQKIAIAHDLTDQLPLINELIKQQLSGTYIGVDGQPHEDRRITQIEATREAIKQGTVEATTGPIKTAEEVRRQELLRPGAVRTAGDTKEAQDRAASRVALEPAPTDVPGLPPGARSREQAGSAAKGFGTQEAQQEQQLMQQANTMRQNFETNPIVKNRNQAAISYQAIEDAVPRKTRAADINIVYGIANLFDPGSVVREGEQLIVKRAQSLPDELLSYINNFKTDENYQLLDSVRQDLLDEARGRMRIHEKSYQDLANSIGGVATDLGIKREHVIPNQPVDIKGGLPPGVTPDMARDEARTQIKAHPAARDKILRRMRSYGVGTEGL